MITFRYSSESEDFFRTIEENPNDLTNYLIFADWLEEHGDSKLARSLRHVVLFLIAIGDKNRIEAVKLRGKDDVYDDSNISFSLHSLINYNERVFHLLGPFINNIPERFLTELSRAKEVVNHLYEINEPNGYTIKYLKKNVLIDEVKGVVLLPRNKDEDDLDLLSIIRVDPYYEDYGGTVPIVEKEKIPRVFNFYGYQAKLTTRGLEIDIK